MTSLSLSYLAQAPERTEQKMTALSIPSPISYTIKREVNPKLDELDQETFTHHL